MPLVSIIIPIYNAEKTLDRCLESIFNQTFKNFEVIGVNDGSTDGSQKILSGYQDQLTIVKQPNQGASSARNAGAKIAQGQLILFVDSDAWLRNDMLEKMVKALEQHPDRAFAYSSFKFGKKTFALWPFNPEKLKAMPYIHTTSLIRKKHFPEFDKNLKRFQDWDLWLTMLERGQTGIFIPEVLFTLEAGGTISHWLPSFAYKIPFLKKVRSYREAKKIIQTKHQL